MKYEWKKQQKEIYLPKEKPEIITIPEFKFFTLKGKGNPNDTLFSEAVGVLYSLSYTVKMLPKKGLTPEGYYDYTVFPLEGVWDLSEKGRKLDYLDKDELIYTIMIRQPDFVTDDIAQYAIKTVFDKKDCLLTKNVSFEKITEGLCVQMLHVGPYDNESESFSKMNDFCKLNNLNRISKIHREIYISDFRKTEASKLKTVLRYNVKKID